MRDHNRELVLSYKGKEVAVLTEAEIVNNTDAIMETGFWQERITEAAAKLGLFNDLHKPKKKAG